MNTIKEIMKISEGLIKTRGWVHRSRGSNKLKFVILRDSTNIIQCVFKKEIFEKQWEILDKLSVESSIEIEGKIKKDDRAITGYEIEVTKFNIVHLSEEFPLNKDSNIEYLLDKRHLHLRSRKMMAILKIRSNIFGAIHEYFRLNNYYEYHSPILQPTHGEDGSECFEIPYFGNKTYLGQTWQLYAEPAIFSLEKIYTISPSFRAEKSVTSRHLTEYWHAEMEIAWADFKTIINEGESLIKHVLKKILENNQEELEILERDQTILKASLNKPFPRMTYDEALKLLKDKFDMNVEWGKDLRTLEEEKIVSLYDTPVVVTHYPRKVKAFYMTVDKTNPEVVEGCDFLAPEGNGEIIGGSHREWNLNKLIERLKEQGEDPKDYEFYLDTRRYGSIPHGGFGLGVERLVRWICGLSTIKDAIPFPRTPDRYTP